MSTLYQVSEVFNSIQGEGVHIGKPATFIRLQGCTVGCPWCDTKQSWKREPHGHNAQTGADIVSSYYASLRPLVVITGGEPTIYDLDDLIMALITRLGKMYGSHAMIQMETSGQNALIGALVPKWVTWSPKPNLHYSCHPSLRRSVDEIKIVVDEDMTLNRVNTIVADFERTTGNRVPVILMPEGAPPKTENVNKILEWQQTKPQYIFGDRLHYRLGIK